MLLKGSEYTYSIYDNALKGGRKSIILGADENVHEQDTDRAMLIQICGLLYTILSLATGHEY